MPKTVRPKRKRKTRKVNVKTNLVNLFVALLTDYFRLGVNQRDIDTLVKRSNSEGLCFLTRTLPRLGDGLLAHLETGCPLNISGFGNCRHGYPKFLSGLFRLVCSPHDINHVPAVKAVYQIACLASKLRGEYSREVLLNQLNDFIRTDSQLPYIEGDSILHYARFLVTKVFRDFDPIDIVPRPGPGAVKTPMKAVDRFRPSKIFRALDDFYHTAEYAYATWYESKKKAVDIIKLMRSQVDYACARLKFVPKKVQKAREICIEENEMQRIQQGLGRKIMKHLEDSPVVGGEINFSKQDYNAQCALLSSKSGSLATLDMSAASNRISLDIVKYLFSKTPLLLEALLASTSKFIDLNNCIPSEHNETQYLELGMLEKRMFAPMGSALCFPIMSVVHWALIRSVIKHTNLNRTRERVFVYGDDLIVPTHQVEPLLDVMPKYGMKFNKEKSFWTGKFRESCGIHAYNGIDITPVYIKYTPENDLSPTALSSVIENEYQFWKRSLTCVSDLYRRVLKLPFVNQKSCVIGWKRPDANFVPISTKKRYCEDLQRWLYKHLVLTSLNEEEHLVDMPSDQTITVLSARQALVLRNRRCWDEDEAYLRRLTTQSNDHGFCNFFRDTNKMILTYRWL